MGYSRIEQETTLVYEAEKGTWQAYSTCPKHIRKLQKLTDNSEIIESDENGNAQALKCTLDEKQVRMVMKRELTEEQKEAARKRLEAAREIAVTKEVEEV